MMKKILAFAVVNIVAVLLMHGASFAQEESEPSEQPVDDEQVLVEAEEIDTAEEGLRQGAYWWAEPEPSSIAALYDLGVDTVAIRLGEVLARPELNIPLDTPVTRIDFTNVEFSYEWTSGGSVTAIQDLPSNLQYRLVVEIKSQFSSRVGNFSDFIEDEVLRPLGESSLNVQAVEIKLQSSGAEISWSAGDLIESISALKENGDSIPLVVGVDARILDHLNGETLNELTSGIDGLVVYFLDYDLTGTPPRITDRRWIDEKCAQLQFYNVPFTIVVPIYNRALVYPAGSMQPSKVLPVIDLAFLQSVSESLLMGIAGTEYTVNQVIEESDVPFGEGDKVRIIESLKDLNLEELIVGLPQTAPNCKEVDLFRFPLVPGFDPTANDAIIAAGWIARPSEADELDPEALEREELDQKYNKGSQIVWMIAMAMMFYLMIRMMRKGQAAKSGDGGGGESK